MSDPRDSSRHSGDQAGPHAGRAPRTEHESQLALEVMLAVSDCLGSWSAFEPGCERLLAELGRRLGHKAGALWLPDGDKLAPRAVWSAPGIDRGALELGVLALRVSRGTGVPGLAWARAEPVTADAVADDGLPEPGGLRGTLGIPAVAGSGVVCVLELYSAAAPPVLGERMTQVLGAVARQLGAFFGSRRAELASSPLTARELDVLVLAALGLSVGAIGERLTISRGTVKSHLEHIYFKLGVANRTAAVAHALRTGLIA